jgi:hypothetical protein
MLHVRGACDIVAGPSTWPSVLAFALALLAGCRSSTSDTPPSPPELNRVPQDIVTPPKAVALVEHLRHLCTQADCGVNGVRVSRRLQRKVSVAVLRSSKATFCLNSYCYSTSLAGLFGHPDGCERRSVALTSLPKESASGDVSLTLGDCDGRAPWRWVIVSYKPYDLRELHDGDVYDFALQSADGRSLAVFHERATYRTYYPNGPDCGPTCRAFNDDRVSCDHPLNHGPCCQCPPGDPLCSCSCPCVAGDPLCSCL